VHLWIDLCASGALLTRVDWFCGGVREIVDHIVMVS
jgi:hypothetical protein